MLRVVGVLVILGSCRSISAMVAGNFIERPRQLRVLQLGLQILETEISYANASLPEALETVARRVDPPVNGIFQ
ncbi:MAG: stage III sporulation protein AB, partial [Firmicutes bacterium]|nr:stage III sporulation protein AB [Bacillota bacterium]